MAGALAASLYAKENWGAKWTGRMGKTTLGGLDRMAGALVRCGEDKNGVVKDQLLLARPSLYERWLCS